MIYLNWQIDCYAAHRARIPALSHLRGAPFSLFSQNSSPLIEMQMRLVSGRYVGFVPLCAFCNRTLSIAASSYRVHSRSLTCSNATQDFTVENMQHFPTLP